jgi:glycosyltransferase involved in cell wall biosynthesis
MNAKIRVLFMQSSSDYWSVTMIHQLLMRYLDRTQIEVHVACHPGSACAPSAALTALGAIPDLHVHPTNFGPALYNKPKREIAKTLLTSGLPAIASPAALVRYARVHHIDIIHAAQMPRDAIWSLFLSKLTGAKSLIHLHMKFGPWLGPLVPWVMRHADGIITCSQFTAQSAIAAGRCAPDKVHPVLNSLDAPLWDEATDGSSIRQEFGIDPDVPLLVSIARQAPRKGGEQLLKALALLKRQGARFKLLMVGEGIPLDTTGQCTYIDTLQALTRELSLTEQVVFTGRRSDVRSILAACDLYTMPSHDEPAAVVFLEAMAMRKPIVALATGGTPELVEHQKAGLLSPAEDIPCLAEHILTLINNPQMRCQMGAYGRRRVEEYFNPQRMAHETARVYQSLLGKHLY